MGTFPEAPLIFVIEADKPEGLLTGGKRLQHFCRARYGPGRHDEHQFDPEVPMQRFGQMKQAPGEGDHFDPALNPAAVLQSQNGRSDLCQFQSWGTASQKRLGEGVHKSEYPISEFGAGDYGRTGGGPLLQETNGRNADLRIWTEQERSNLWKSKQMTAV